MSSHLFRRYIWLADTIYRAGCITFAEINRRWLLNSLSEGKPIPPRRIVIKCTGGPPQYLRALPLHTSQEEIEQHEGWSLFAYYLAPTNEFFRKILSYREFIEIVAPEEVRQEYAEILTWMLELHK